MTMTQVTRRTGEPPGSSLAVSTTGLTKRFGDRTVVDGVGRRLVPRPTRRLAPCGAAPLEAPDQATGQLTANRVRDNLPRQMVGMPRAANGSGHRPGSPTPARHSPVDYSKVRPTFLYERQLQGSAPSVHMPRRMQRTERAAREDPVLDHVHLLQPPRQGFIQGTFVNLAKSVSVETTVSPCSRASAAR
jgi:hypothetical protein